MTGINALPMPAARGIGGVREVWCATDESEYHSINRNRLVYGPEDNPQFGRDALSVTVA